MDRKELEDVKVRLRKAESRAEDMASRSELTPEAKQLVNAVVYDARRLFDEVSILGARQDLLVRVADASIKMWSLGAGLLRGALVDLRDRWPTWQNDTCDKDDE